MSDQQDRPDDNVAAEEIVIDQENATFDEEAAEIEAESAAIEKSADELSVLLDAAQKKVDEHHEKLMRVHAEMDNLKRRHTQELEKAHKFALDKFVNELLPVWDSLELGNAAAQDDAADVSKLREGTELTLKMLDGVMGKFGVEQVDPDGDAFNPDLHQAISMQPRDDVEANTVIGVIQKGYSLNGRLVRPAMVVVSQLGTPPTIDENA